MALNRQLSGPQIDKKKTAFGKMNCIICFFIDAAIKVAVLMNWRATTMSLCKSNNQQLEIQKRYFSSKCCLGFCAFDFEIIPHPSCYFSSIMDKTRHGSVIAFFQQNFSSFYSLCWRCPRNQNFSTVCY